MAADFRLKQNLSMSPNAQIKNLVPENLSNIPPVEEWKVGRFWFNTTIGKLQGVFLKLDKKTGLPIEPNEMEIRVVGADALGPTKDGEYWPDGLFDFNEQTKIADAMDEVNEALKDLAPAEATYLRGNLDVKNSFKTGKVSKQNEESPDTIRMVGISEGTSINYIITEPAISATLPTVGLVVKGEQQQQFGKADDGIMKIFVNDTSLDDGIDLKSQFKESSRDHFGVVQGFDPEIQQTVTDVQGNTKVIEANPNKLNFKSSTGSLTINTIQRYNNFKKWQRGTGTVNFTVTPGRHTFYVEHSEIIAGPYKTNDSAVFYDPNKTAPTTTINELKLLTGNTKTVSGVSFYNSNLSFVIDLTSNNLFNYTYWDKPIELSSAGTDAGLINWNDTQSNLSEKTVPTWNDVFELKDYVINYTKANSQVDVITVKAKGGKVATGWGTTVSASIKMLIDTNPVTGNSTLLKETFLDEYYRFDVATLNFDSVTAVNGNDGSWDSTRLLVDGEAQQFNGDLIIPQHTYNDYGSTVDYTVFSATKYLYYRRFNSVNKPNSNGTIKLITDGIINTDFEIFIKFPSLTGWLDISELFDNMNFTNNYKSDGIGCATAINKTSDGYTIPWSIGTLSTVNSGFGYVIKVIVKSKTKRIKEIEEISETWR